MIDIKTVLENHRKWLYGEPDGCRANLCDADLRDANLCDADLRGADLRGADLRDANLCDADLRDANLCDADLCRANLRDANLCDADLRRADLCGADLRGADLRGADLRDANLCDAVWNLYSAFYPMQCPETGSYIGYKKAGGKIVTLEILEDALRSSATSRKCRASKAKVISITNLTGDVFFEMVSSDYDINFVYRVGETVEVNNFDTNRWIECAPGIHHFITRQEAVMYI